MHLCKVFLNTSDESSEIPSVTITVRQFTLCYITDILTKLPIITFYIRLDYILDKTIQKQHKIHIVLTFFNHISSSTARPLNLFIHQHRYQGEASCLDIVKQ